MNSTKKLADIDVVRIILEDFILDLKNLLYCKGLILWFTREFSFYCHISQLNIFLIIYIDALSLNVILHF